MLGVKWVCAGFVGAVMLGSVASASEDDLIRGLAAFQAADYSLAYEKFRPLAEQGNVTAQAGLGYFYSTGYGVNQDYAEAARWSRAAAEEGHPLAQATLGHLTSSGLGVTQDYVEAAKWHRRAAEQGVSRSQGLLAGLYAMGKGVLHDDVRAHMWANIAVANGMEDALELRNALAMQMSRDEIAEAQRLARQCLESGYTDCD